MSSVALTRLAPAHIARATIAKHSKSFALASRLLDTRMRDQTAVVYTWCRRADDAIDEIELGTKKSARSCFDLVQPADNGSKEERARSCFDLVQPADNEEMARSCFDRVQADTSSVQVARLRLTRLHAELAGAYVGGAVDPVLAAFGDVCRERAIPVLYPAELLAGMAMDVAESRYATMADLRLYCWRVAGVVGLMMTHVFGVRDDRALVHAAHLGIAMQLTNICRDVAEDWQRGRLYVPDDVLARHGAGGLAGELGRELPASARAPLASCLRELLGVADRYYASGDRGLSALPWRAALAVKAASNVYRAIGGRIAATGYDVTAGRAVVSTSGKLARVAAAAMRIAIMRNARDARVPTKTLEIGDVTEP